MENVRKLPILPTGTNAPSPVCNQFDIGKSIFCQTRPPSYLGDFVPNATPTAFPTSSPVVQQSPNNGFIAGLALFGFIAVFATVMFALFSKSTSTNAPSATGIPARADVVIAPAAAAAQQTEVDLVKSMTRKQRREYVANFLITEKFMDNEGGSSNDNERSSSFIIAKSMRSLNDSDAHQSCAICLDQFEDGEDICSSQNRHCKHQFHLSCTFEWLLKSQECPCCRRDYLTIENSTLDLEAAQQLSPSNTDSAIHYANATRRQQRLVTLTPLGDPAPSSPVQQLISRHDASPSGPVTYTEL